MRRVRGVVLVALAGLLLSAGGAIAGDEERREKQVEQLAIQLELTPDQIERVRQIMKVDQDLAAIDRQRYSQDRSAFRAAAQKRREDTRKEIEAVLTEDQLSAYRKIRPQRAPGTRTLDLAERLNLDDGQTEQLEQILASSRTRELRDRLQASRGDRNAMRNLRDELQAAQKKQDKRIEAMLTNEQKQAYKKVIEERQQEMDARRDQMKGRSGGRGGGRGQGGW